MHIEFAHLRDQGIDFAVFFTDAVTHMDNDRANLLAQLTAAARSAGRKVDKSALAFREGNRVRYFGIADLVRYLSALAVVPQPTHTLDV